MITPGMKSLNKTLIAVLVAIGLAGADRAAWGESLEPGTAFQDCSECPEVVIIPSGEFMMGSPANEASREDDEGPIHRVTIPAAFAVGKHEVTFDEWDACVGAGGCSHKPKDMGWGRGRRPVVNVGWNDAQEYMAWLSNKTGKTYRLLSEAEWEYVARAGTTTRFNTGDNISVSEANSNIGYTAPVGSYSANHFGLHDLHGNILEWVEDCWNDDYKGCPRDGSAWTEGNCSLRVLRGGSWINSLPDLRSAFRNRYGPNTRFNYFGFRVARTLPR